MKVEIWADLVCPWCYIGERRLSRTLAEFAHGSETEVIWRSFQLDPDAPEKPEQTVNEMLAKKYGVSLEQAEAMNVRVSQIAAADGLEYHIDRAVYVNTFNAHRLNHLAAAHAVQTRLGERLFRFYFTESGNLADIDALVGMAAEAGIPAAEAREVLLGTAYADAVKADIDAAHRLGVQGVPFVVVNGTYGISGAQPASVIAATLERAWAESR